MSKYLLTLSLLGLASEGFTEINTQNNCAPVPPATCFEDECRQCYCLGPENYMVNAPVCPKTCNGDFIIQVAGFYWNAHQDGMEYALETSVQNPFIANPLGPSTAETQVLNNLVDAEYFTPNFKWDWGFKIGLGYCTTCDGWDLGVTWTWYRGKAFSHIEAEADDQHTLLPLWSAFAPANGGVLFATDAESRWKLSLNLVDLDLGRNFWTSKYLALRPYIGIRIAYIKQGWDIEYKGGSWSAFQSQSVPLVQAQSTFNNEVCLNNNFHGVGPRAGLSSEWNLGCGWGIYGNWALAIVYGRFSIDHEEHNTQAVAPYNGVKILESDSSFRASRALLDLALGLQYSEMFCDCAYGFTGMIGWEHHHFFHQNQMWRVVRLGDNGALPLVNNLNNSGENGFFQRRGSLDTQGWTLTLKFEF